MKKYLSCAETAKLVRAALKESFPGVKFKVKSSVYAGGASITVSYFNGPTDDQVKGIVDTFTGAYFCGMTDYKGTLYNTLDGVPVSFGADYIFVSRYFTKPILTLIACNVLTKFGLDNAVTINEYSNGGAYVDTVGPNQDSADRGFTYYQIEALINDAANKYSAYDAAESATVKRVKFLGDDGYGYGTVGKLEVA